MPTCLLLTVWFLICILDSVHLVRAQNQMGATTHPDEGLCSVSDHFGIIN